MCIKYAPSTGSACDSCYVCYMYMFQGWARQVRGGSLHDERRDREGLPHPGLFAATSLSRNVRNTNFHYI